MAQRTHAQLATAILRQAEQIAADADSGPAAYELTRLRAELDLVQQEELLPMRQPIVIYRLPTDYERLKTDLEADARRRLRRLIALDVAIIAATMAAIFWLLAGQAGI